jgi:hypothetical protein
MIRIRGVKSIVALLAIAALPAWSFGQETPKTAKKAPEEKSKGVQIELHFENLQFEFGNDKSDDKKIKEIEAKVAELTKQLQALKQGKQPPEAPKKTIELKLETIDLDNLLKALEKTPSKSERKLEQGPMPRELAKGHAGPNGEAILSGGNVYQGTPTLTSGFLTGPDGPDGLIIDEPESSKPIALSRATYKLSKEKAEALMAFLNANTKPAVLEFKVEEKGLTITTTPEFQTAIAGIAKLMRGEPELHFKLRLSDQKK